MFSQLRHFSLADGQQRRVLCADVAIPRAGETDYPEVTHVCVAQTNGGLGVLPWRAVQAVHWQARQLHITNLQESQEATQAFLTHHLLLGHDILDALLIDVPHRRVTRANDLWLAEIEGKLQLRAADMSVQALLRRLTRGWYHRVQWSALQEWQTVVFCRGTPRAAAPGRSPQQRLRTLPPGDIAHLTAMLPYLHAAELITSLPDAQAADVLEAMLPERQLQVFEELAEGHALRLLALMAPDTAADLVGRLTPASARGYLNRLPPVQGNRIIELLRYPETTVGGMMTNDIVLVPAHVTVGEARDSLRQRLREPDFVYFLYVVDTEESRQLRGVLTLRELLVAEDSRRIEELMNPHLLVLHPLEEARAAAYRLINSHLVALPVVGHKGQLLGAVTVDAAVAYVAPQSWSSLAPRVFS